MEITGGMSEIRLQVMERNKINTYDEYCAIAKKLRQAPRKQSTSALVELLQRFQRKNKDTPIAQINYSTQTVQELGESLHPHKQMRIIVQFISQIKEKIF